MALGASEIGQALLPREARAAGGFVVQVTEVLATGAGEKGPKTIDPLLKELAGQLEKYDYRVFTRAGVAKATLAAGAAHAFPLAAEKGFTLSVAPAPAPEKDELQIAVRLTDADKKDVLVTGIKVKDGGTAIIAKELADKRGRLFIAITVKRE